MFVIILVGIQIQTVAVWQCMGHTQSETATTQSLLKMSDVKQRDADTKSTPNTLSVPINQSYDP